VVAGENPEHALPLISQEREKYEKSVEDDCVSSVVVAVGIRHFSEESELAHSVMEKDISGGGAGGGAGGGLGGGVGADAGLPEEEFSAEEGLGKGSPPPAIGIMEDVFEGCTVVEVAGFSVGGSGTGNT
jgi:hypothetical protein